MACRMRLAHGRTTPTAAPGPLLVPLSFLPWPEICFLPSSLSRPPPFPPSATVVTRGLAFPFEARISNAFPLPPKTKSGAAPQGSSAPFRKNRTRDYRRSATRRPISAQPTRVQPSSMMSPVRKPSRRVWRTAFSTASASSDRPKARRSIMPADRMVASGLALS